MANKNLATADSVSSMLRTDSVMVEVNGSIRRISLDNFIESLNSGDTQMLRSVAWGVPIKQTTQSSPNWGRVGNLDLFEEYKSQCGRYLVKNNGHGAKLGKSNSGIYADGTPLDESIGHVLWHAPELHYRVLLDSISGEPILWMSQVPLGGHSIPEQNVGAYMGSMSGSALTSRSGQTVAANKTITAFWNAAQVNGSEWGLEDYNFRRLLMMLCLSEYGNPDIQNCLGNGVGGVSGVTWANAQSLPTGATKSNGDQTAANSIDVGGTNSNRINFLGVEDPYQWYWEFIQGIYFGISANSDQDGTEVFIYEGNRLPSSSELATHPDGDYRQLTRLTTNGYVKEMVCGEFFDLIATVLGGGGSSYWADYFYGNTTGQVCLWGASAEHAANAGLGFAYSDDAWSVSYSHFGSRLAYYGKLTKLDGKELVAE